MLGRRIDGWGLGSLLLPSLQFMINEHLTSDLGMTNTGALGRDPQLGIPFSIRTRCRGGGGNAVKRKMKKCGKVRKKCGKMRRKKAMTRTELPVALHVIFQQHSFPVTRILVPGPKHTDGKFVF